MTASGPLGTPLPENLLAAIAHPNGGRVVLVTGAGSSVEAPTSLPLASALAAECHRKLVEDLVISESACEDPEDLSAVADAVYAATGTQRPLVDRFPPERFQHAEPNSGHLLAAALLREGAISTVMTLNFDMAQASALSQIGAIEVSRVGGPEDHGRLGLLNLIHLHRTIDADPETLILRSGAQATEWMGQWEEVVVRRVVASPVVIITGLGTPATVLVETITAILVALEQADTTQVYVVGPSPLEESKFATALSVGADSYVQLAWGELMQEMGNRLAAEQAARLRQACAALSIENEWAPEEVGGLSDKLSALGLLRLGRLRAAWMLDQRRYFPDDAGMASLMADVLLGLAIVERVTGVDLRFTDEGLVEISSEAQGVGRILVSSGRGINRWALVTGKLSLRRRVLALEDEPVWALVSGIPGGQSDLAPPDDIVLEQEEDDLLFAGQGELRMVTVDELRQDPSLAERLVS